MILTKTMPRSAVDLFAEETIDDPYPVFRELREAGPAVYLERLDAWAVTHFEHARYVLKNWSAFSSKDIALNEACNQYVGDGIIRADPPLHTQLRGVLADRLAPRALKLLQTDIRRRAQELVDGLVSRGSFDAVGELSRRFPLEVVADLIGLPQQGREELLELIDANFNFFGPENHERTQQAISKLDQLVQYVMANARADVLTEGSMGKAVFDAAEAGKIDPRVAPWLVLTYVTAGIDTTVHGIGNAIWLLGQHPEQWETLRANPSTIPGAFREALRCESPVQLFGRTVVAGCSIGDVELPAGSRLVVLFGAANRDPAKWKDPDRFDIGRDNIDQLSFGYGLHGCAGRALATMEGEAMLGALVSSVARFEIGEPVRHYNNMLRGLGSLPVTVTAG
ncbi:MULTISPECIES: cytochrome P450 [unclassified Mycolicibacterium]|uniref:cytochrome P450 n=1 Tax=unclassified Mycolicibacterium TaxID=2636767 RepID=UPI002ED9C8BA